LLAEAFCPQSVTLVLEDDIDVSRGDMIIGPDHLPGASADLRAKVCWLHPRSLQRGRKYLLKHTTRTVQALVTAVEDRIDMATLEPEPEPTELGLNDIGQVRLSTSGPLVFDGYATNRLTGSFILIEPGSNGTVGAGMLLPPATLVKPEYDDFAI
jgi:bifunctional enzyme CysN/CysC/sulfate adenylyltransferase subunit 1